MPAKRKASTLSKDTFLLLTRACSKPETDTFAVWPLSFRHPAAGGTCLLHMTTTVQRRLLPVVCKQVHESLLQLHFVFITRG